jgi:two-component system, NtrC family, sensor kinase
MSVLAEKFFSKGLKRKLILTTLGIGIIPLMLANIISYFQGNKSLQGVMGTSFKALAYETSTKIDLLIQKQIKINRRFSKHPTVGLFIKEHNKRWERLSEGNKKRRLELNKELWEKKEGIFKELTENPSARQLGKFFLQDESFGLSTLAVFLIDKNGVLVAALNGNQPYINFPNKNLTSINDSLISDIYFDQINDQYVFRISIAVKDSQGNTIGYFQRVYSAKDFFSPFIEPITFGETGHVMLVNSNGVVIDCPILPTGSRLPLELTKSVTKSDPNWVITEGNGHGSDEISIIGYSPISTLQKDYKEFQIPPWFTFVWQSSDELFAPMDNLFIWICSASLFSILLILVMGSAAAEKIVKPIKILQKAAGRIGRGEHVDDIEIRTGDEIETLCDEINTMNKMLQKSFSGLERQVEIKAQEVIYIKDYTDSILMSIPDMVLITDENRKVEYVNSAVDKLIHLKEENIIGKTFEDLGGEYYLVWRELQNEMEKIFPKLSKSDRPFTDVAEEYKPRDPLAPVSKNNDAPPQPFVSFGERTFTYRFFAVGIRGEKEKRIGLLMREITEEKKLMDQLIMAEKLSGLGTLTAGIAHEMNNPLYSIMGFTEAIQDESDISKIHKFANKVLNSSRHMASVILNFSGYSRNKMEDEASEVDINECIEVAVEIALMASMTDGIQLSKNFSPLKSINAKSEEIQQIFVNIIKNSVQAMQGKGRLTISTSLKEDDIEIIIKDTGPGIPKEFLPKIFDPFFTTKPQGEGTGLGLNIVHKIIQKYGGKVEVDSVLGMGAEFKISFSLEKTEKEKKSEVLT